MKCKEPRGTQKSIKISQERQLSILCGCSHTTLNVPAGGASQQSGAHSGCKGQKKKTQIRVEKKEVQILYYHPKWQCFASPRSFLDSASASSYPFFSAGSTQAAKEPVDHLNGTENQLQAARGQQRSKQSNVELHNVFRLCAHPPPCVVIQVTPVSVQGETLTEWSGLWTLERCHQKVTYPSLKGCRQTRRTLQRGPFFKPSTATIKLYRAPTTPTAANAIDRNICRN